MDDLTSFRALQRFVDYWERKNAAVEAARPADHPRFRASIVYDTQDRSVAAVTTMTVSRVPGFDDGCVSLSQTRGLTSEEFQLEFNPRLQAYSYNSSTHALAISGRSEKMGNYCVTMTPVEANGPGGRVK